MNWWDQAFPFVIGATATLVATVLVDALRGRRERRHRFDGEKFRVYVDALRACNDGREVLHELGKVEERQAAIEVSLGAARESLEEAPTARAPGEPVALHEALAVQRIVLDPLKASALKVHDALSASRAAIQIVAPRLVLARFNRLRVAAEDDGIDDEEYFKRLSACADVMRRDLGTQRWTWLESVDAVPHLRKYGID